jgi:predicted amidohydrolase
VRSRRRLSALRAALVNEPEPVTAIAHLLRFCRKAHEELWEFADEPCCVEWARQVLAPVAAKMTSRAPKTTLPQEIRRLMADALTDIPEHVHPVVVAHELAQFLDQHFQHAIGPHFRRLSPHEVGPDAPVPLDDPGLVRILHGSVTAPPWRLAQPLDETPHLRLAGDWARRYRVILDYSLDGHLAGLASAGTQIATVHPNRSLDELVYLPDSAGRLFNVRPRDEAAQAALLDHLVGRAVDAGADIVVVPELSVTPALAQGLRTWVDRSDGPRLVVAGSYHITAAGSSGRTARQNLSLTWARSQVEPLISAKHSPATHPFLEDFRPTGRPELRVHVADGWHLVIAVCRDLLNPEFVRALAGVGANLVLVPAMSESLLAFGGPVAQLVGSCQAVVAVANNPALWPNQGGRRSRTLRAVFGHPGLPQQTAAVDVPGGRPGVALLNLGSGLVSWI